MLQTSQSPCQLARAASRDGFRGGRRADDDSVQILPSHCLEPCCAQKASGTLLRPGLAATPGEKRHAEQSRELVSKNQVPSGRHHPRAFPESCALIRPVVERRCAHDQVESAVRVRQLLRGARRESQTIIIGHRPGRLDHRRRRINPGELDRLRSPGGKLPQQIAGAAPHVQDTAGTWHGGQSQVCCTVRDVVVQPAEPAGLIAGRPPVERRYIMITRHQSILPSDFPARNWPGCAPTRPLEAGLPRCLQITGDAACSCFPLR